LGTTDSVQTIVRITRGLKKNDVFIILLLYMDDMLVIGPNKDRVQELKAQLAREFDMKDLGPANKILGMQIYRDRSKRKIWLS
jgi:ATP-binding cassette subfamily B (MDR/TAP) protein 1